MLIAAAEAAPLRKMPSYLAASVPVGMIHLQLEFRPVGGYIGKRSHRTHQHGVTLHDLVYDLRATKVATEVEQDLPLAKLKYQLTSCWLQPEHLAFSDGRAAWRLEAQDASQLTSSVRQACPLYTWQWWHRFLQIARQPLLKPVSHDVPDSRSAQCRYAVMEHIIGVNLLGLPPGNTVNFPARSE